MGMDSRKASRFEVADSLEAAQSRVTLQTLGDRRTALGSHSVVVKTATTEGKSRTRKRASLKAVMLPCMHRAVVALELLQHRIHLDARRDDDAGGDTELLAGQVD